MGLLDTLDDPQTRLGLGLLAAAAPRFDNAGMGQRLMEAVGSMDQWRQQQAAQKRADMTSKLYQLQLQEAQRKLDSEKQLQELAKQYIIPAQPGLSPLAGDPTTGILPSAGRPAKPAGFDFAGYAQALAGVNPTAALSVMQALEKDNSPIAVKPGEVLVERKTFKPVFSQPKEVDEPASVKEYKFAKLNGETRPYSQWLTDGKRAGATNVVTKVENKMGESLAGQIGPIVKETYTAANGAAQQVDAASRIVKAVDSGSIISGPLANPRLKMAQIGVALGVGGADDAQKIARTREVIRGLAEMTLQGRKQMTGQGAITESESALAEKANSGNIDDLTPAEIKQLANASARAAKFAYDQHIGNLNNMAQDPATAGIAKFYKPMPLPAYNFEPPKSGVVKWGDLK